MKMVLKALNERSSIERAEKAKRFFKTNKGEYGEGDIFLGVSVPDCRLVAGEFWQLADLKCCFDLLKSELHEARLTALFLLINKYKSKNAKHEWRKEIVDNYILHLDYVNNWDLVDSSAYYLLGRYLYEYNIDRDILYDLAQSDHLWRQRVSIVATYYFIKKKDYTDTLRIARLLIAHEHDMIHKAVGWMLKEIAKMSPAPVHEFLNAHAEKMPRTMLRNTIEKFAESERSYYLNKKRGYH